MREELQQLKDEKSSPKWLYKILSVLLLIGLISLLGGLILGFGISGGSGVLGVFLFAAGLTLIIFIYSKIRKAIGKMD